MSSERTLEQERLVSIVRRFSQRKILVIGDAIADQFVYGAISRVSREAPVFILSHEHTETLPGGAANCAANLASLGASVSLISATGNDPAGQALLERLVAARVNCQGVSSLDQLKTPTKVRILAGQAHSTRQQVIRIDYDHESAVNQDFQEQMRERILEQARDAEAIIISDYNYGIASDQLTAFIRDAATARKIPILVDSRSRLDHFSGFTSATPNEDEVEHLLSEELNDSQKLASSGEKLRERLDYRALLITRGGNGMLLLEAGVAPLHLPAIGSSEPVDVTGAGDTVIATYTLALASDASFPDAARLANHAGGLVVMKRGTASVTVDELESSILGQA